MEKIAKKMKKGRFDFLTMKKEGVKLTWVTAYDYPIAHFAELAGIDMILVGDSLGMVVYGYDGTIPVTMDECIIHCKAVRRGAPATFVVGDMPFLSYQTSVYDAITNAGRFLKEAGMDAIKLEGGRRVTDKIRGIADAGHPGHRPYRPDPPEQRAAGRLQGAGTDCGQRRGADPGCPCNPGGRRVCPAPGGGPAGAGQGHCGAH